MTAGLIQRASAPPHHAGHHAVLHAVRSTPSDRLVALFEPDHRASDWVCDALAANGHRWQRIDDPATRGAAVAAPDAALALVNPFRSAASPRDAIALARWITGGRPVLALTEHDSAQQRALAIAAGADDAMSPQGSAAELGARVDALMRRSLATIGLLHCGAMEIDLIDRSVRVAGIILPMPSREFLLLVALVRAGGQTVPREELLRRVWQLDFDPGTNRIEVHVSRLRCRLATLATGVRLTTVKMIGYRLEHDPAPP